TSTDATETEAASMDPVGGVPTSTAPSPSSLEPSSGPWLPPATGPLGPVWTPFHGPPPPGGAATASTGTGSGATSTDHMGKSSAVASLGVVSGSVAPAPKKAPPEKMRPTAYVTVSASRVDCRSARKVNKALNCLKASTLQSIKRQDGTRNRAESTAALLLTHLLRPEEPTLEPALERATQQAQRKTSEAATQTTAVQRETRDVAIQTTEGTTEPAGIPVPTPLHMQSTPEALPERGRTLTAATLAAAAPGAQKQLIGERLSIAVFKYKPELTDKITSMLLALDNSELLTLLDNETAFRAKVDEAERELVQAMTLRMMGQARPSVRSKTVAPKPELALLRAEEGARALKLQQFANARAACSRLQKYSTSFEQFLEEGSFKQFHNQYHLAKEGQVVPAGAPHIGPPPLQTSRLQTPACGNWIWSLVASLTTKADTNPQIWVDRRNHSALGDAVESWLYHLWSQHTPETLQAVQEYATAADNLLQLMHGIPSTLYYRVTWKQSWATLREELSPWLAFDEPLQLEDEPQLEVPEADAHRRSSSTNGPRNGCRAPGRSNSPRACGVYMSSSASCAVCNPLSLPPLNMLPAPPELHLLAQVAKGLSARRAGRMTFKRRAKELERRKDLLHLRLPVGGPQERDPRTDRRKKDVSKALSQILRHTGRRDGLVIEDSGYASLREVLRQQRLADMGATREEILAIAEESGKQRFHVQQREAGCYIRAAQGHSIRIDDEQLLTPVLEPQEAPTAIHGTMLKHYAAIYQDGLRAGGEGGQRRRKHVHFAVSLPKSTRREQSGMRANVEVLTHLNVSKALQDGMLIYRSTNDVILTEGFSGLIHPRYFSKVQYYWRGEGHDVGDVEVPSPGHLQDVLRSIGVQYNWESRNSAPAATLANKAPWR
ncbi:unnamed protein product, partial [Symbiodinium sp. CCMP2456]